MTALLPAARGVPGRGGRRRRVARPLLLGAGLLVACVALHVHDPHRSGSWGYCPWLFLTGTYCPACGGLRAVNDLTRGDVGAAASSNLEFVASLPLLAVLYGRWLVNAWRGTTSQVSSRRALLAAAAFLALTVVFWVVRNLPFGAWLAP